MNINKSDNTVREVFITDDKSVIKLIHDDDSETAIKVLESQTQAINPLTGNIETFKANRDKYSIFISASTGCVMKCPFCHLTIKNAAYQKLTRDEILSNLKSAMLIAKEHHIDLDQKYVKLSWMGMGEAIFDPEGVKEVSLKFLNWLFENKLAKGLDGVDLSTVMPNIKNINLDPLGELNNELKTFSINPKNVNPDNIASSTFKTYKNRSPFRLFYSLHAVDTETRDVLVPNSMPLLKAIEVLTNWEHKYNCNLILHQLILDGKNDSWDEIKALTAFIQTHLTDNELRVLRYNVCVRSTDKETTHFNQIIKYLSENIKYLKVQISPGKEVSAACGQFIVKSFIEVK